MRSHALKSLGQPTEPLDGPAPVPAGTEVVVEVTRCGVCHSDLHLQDGFYDLGRGRQLSLVDRGVKLPLVMGHEVLGRLVAAGPDAPIGQDQIGRSFLVYPWLGCGQCETCRRGEENSCSVSNSIGVFRPGGYAEQCLVPHPRYLIDVEGIDPALAATYACSGLTAYSALRKAALDHERDWLLVLGAGGLGLNALQIARALGQKHIVVGDIDPTKREAALAAGADMVVDPAAPDAVATLQALDGGVAATIDFVGASPTAEFGTSVIRKAGTYVAVGLFGGELHLSVPLLILRAITVRGSYVGNLRELRELVELARSGKVAPMPVETVPMEQVNEALSRLRAGQVTGRLVLAREP